MPRRHRQSKPAGTLLPSGKVQPAQWASDAGPANTGKGRQKFGGPLAAAAPPSSSLPAGKEESGVPAIWRNNKNRIYRHPLPLPVVPTSDVKVYRDQDLLSVTRAKERARKAREKARAAAKAAKAEAAAAALLVAQENDAGDAADPANSAVPTASSVADKPNEVEALSETWSEWIQDRLPSSISSYITSLLDAPLSVLRPILASRSTVGADQPLHLKLTGHYDPITCSIWITDPQTAAALWQRGFFGKGNLSRSEPSWRARQIHTLTILEQRRRINAATAAAAAEAEAGQAPAPSAHVGLLTSEELTAIRRRERQSAKIERAKAAVLAGTQLPDGVEALGGKLEAEELEQYMKRLNITSTTSVSGDKADQDAAAAGTAEAQDDGYRGEHVPGLIFFREPALAKMKEATDTAADAPKAAGAMTAQVSTPAAASAMTAAAVETLDAPIDIQIEEMEYVQLTMVEVFFLSIMLKTLRVMDEDGNEMSETDLYALCLTSHSHITALSSLSAPSPRSISSTHLTSRDYMRPDNPFFLNYIAYHHYRSLGWVVKSGLKFCVDFLLYKRGPVFGHAEFSIVVIPSYEDPQDESSCPYPRHPSSLPIDWVRFSSLNRVNTQVFKTVILCYVSIPSVQRCDREQLLASPEKLVQGIREGKSFAVKDVAIRRWVPARMRP